jgi:pimeloyl-ACP methyl ester carboxylesterase
MRRFDRDFISHGNRCAAWLFLPEGGARPPVVVMAHGFAAERAFRLPAFAEKFAAAGLACLVFDYRNFGDSEGEPRNLVDPGRHLEDWRAAIAHARQLPEVDGRRLGLWGSSFSGGHVLVTAARDGDVAAVVSQVPYVGGIEIELSLANKLRAAAALLLDRVASWFGSAYYIPVVAPPGVFGCLTAPEASRYFDIIPPGSSWRNAVPARILLAIAGYQPRDHAADVKSPTLMVVATGDQTTPPDLATECASRIAQAEVATYDCGHFGVYLGETFEQVAAREADFLTRHLLSGP